MLAGTVPSGAGEGLGGGELPGLPAVDGFAHLAPAGRAVLLEAAFLGPAAGLGLGQDPGAAAFHLDLGEAGAAAEGVVGEPLWQALFVSGRMLDLPTVRSGSCWSWSFLVAGQVARKRCRRVARGSLNRHRYSGAVFGNCELGS